MQVIQLQFNVQARKSAAAKTAVAAACATALHVGIYMYILYRSHERGSTK